MRLLDCISQFPQRDTATRCSVLKMEERGRRRLGWKKWRFPFFSLLLLFALADSFLLRGGARTRFYMCELIIEQKPTLYYGEKKKPRISPALSKCSVSHAGIRFLSSNWTLIVFQSPLPSITICMKNTLCGGNDDQNPGGDDRRSRIMTP